MGEPVAMGACSGEDKDNTGTTSRSKNQNNSPGSTQALQHQPPSTDPIELKLQSGVKFTEHVSLDEAVEVLLLRLAPTLICRKPADSGGPLPIALVKALPIWFSGERL